MKNTSKVSAAASHTTNKQIVKMSGVDYGYIKGDIFFQTRKMTDSVRHSVTVFLVTNFVTPATDLF
jgi:hypothetical protein